MAAARTISIIATAIAAAVSVAFIAPEVSPSQFLAHDFLQYWSAFRIASDGLNPYDVEAMDLAQKSLGHDQGTVMMLVVPWVLLLMSPILAFPFSESAILWGIANCLFIGISIWLTWQLYGHKSKLQSPLQLALVFAFNISLVCCIMMGQLGCLMCLLTICAIRFHITGNIPAKAFCMALWTIKLHTVYLLIPFLLLNRDRGIDWKCIKWGAIWMSIILSVNLAIFPDALLGYIESICDSSSALRTQVTEFRVATLVGLLRHLSVEHFGTSSPWIMSALPMIALVFTIWFLLRYYQTKDLLTIGPVFLCLSIFTSPYGWLFDQCTLAVIPVALLALASAGSISTLTRYKTIGAAVFLQVVAIVELLFFNGPHAFSFLPIAMLALWWFGLHPLKLRQNLLSN